LVVDRLSISTDREFAGRGRTIHNQEMGRAASGLLGRSKISPVDLALKNQAPMFAKPMPAPARLAAGLFALLTIGVAGWILADIVATDGSWLEYLSVSVLLFAAFDFGVTGAVRGKWPLLSWLGAP
jgi:hypothetical protein